MLGEMMASQLRLHLLEEVLGDGADGGQRFVTSPEVGGYLSERLYRGGKTLDWRGTLRQATGQSLSVAAFVEDLAGRV